MRCGKFWHIHKYLHIWYIGKSKMEMKKQMNQWIHKTKKPHSSAKDVIPFHPPKAYMRFLWLDESVSEWKGRGRERQEIENVLWLCSFEYVQHCAMCVLSFILLLTLMMCFVQGIAVATTNDDDNHLKIIIKLPTIRAIWNENTGIWYMHLQQNFKKESWNI